MIFSIERKNVIIPNSFCNRSLTDRTQDSDSCNVGSIPAGCIFIHCPAVGPDVDIFILISNDWDDLSGANRMYYLYRLLQTDTG